MTPATTTKRRTNRTPTHGGPRPGAGRPRKVASADGARNADRRQSNQKRGADGATSTARARLLDAARELVAGCGYETLTVTGLCSEAGLSPQTFYEHFADKRALIAAIHGPEIEEIDRRLRAAVAEQSPLAPSLAQALDSALASLHPSPSSPRARLVEAMIDLAGEHGVDAVTIPELAAKAGVNRGIFYRHFTDRLDCLAKASALLLERIEDATREAAEGADDPCERVRLALASLCGQLADDPRSARVVLVEEAALSGRERRLADLLCSELEASFPDAPETAHRTAAGGVCSLLRSELLAAGARALRDLAPDATFAALSPLTGTERALAEMHRPRPERPASGSTPTPEPTPTAHHPHLPTGQRHAGPPAPELSTTTPEPTATPRHPHLPTPQPPASPERPELSGATPRAKAAGADQTTSREPAATSAGKTQSGKKGNRPRPGRRQPALRAPALGSVTKEGEV